MNQDEDLKAKAAHDKLQERLAAMKLKKNPTYSIEGEEKAQGRGDDSF